MQAVVCGRHGDGASVDLKDVGRVEAVGLGRDVQGAARDHDVTLLGIFVVLAVDTVGAGDQGPRAAHNGHRVLGLYGVLGGRDAHLAADQHQIVLAHDAVAGRAGEREAARAVDREVVFGKDRSVDGVVVGLDKLAAGGHRVGGAVCQGEEDLLGVLNVEGGRVRAGDVGAGKDQLDLGILGVDHDLAGRERAAHHVGARLGDGHGRAVAGRAVTVHRSHSVRQVDLSRARLVIGRVLVAVAHHVVDVDQGHGVARGRGLGGSRGRLGGCCRRGA